MAAFVPAPQVVSLDAIWIQNGQNCENTFYYHMGHAVTLADLVAIGAEYIAWAAGTPEIWNTHCSLLKVYMRDLTTQFGLVWQAVPDPAIVGTSAGTPTPNNVTIAIKRESGLAGRANRGRVYHIGLDEGHFSDTNTVSSAFGATLMNRYHNLLTGMAGTPGATEVILHRKLGTHVDVQGYVLTDLTVDSQRRRLPGHNIHH